MTRARRLLVSATALALAFACFHGQLAAAVVTRGDDVLHRGDTAGALRLYQRALALDPSSAIAADRLAFSLTMRHDGPSARRAIDVITQAIAAGAEDPALFADRAFAEIQLHAWRAAEHDFGRAGMSARDARYEHFAARMALRSHDRAAARRYAQLALVDDPTFAPARAVLRALR
jgi:tetratricopeptide (TPR) repeat protein